MSKNEYTGHDLRCTTALTRSTAKAFVQPIDHFTGARLTHRTFYATIALRGTDANDFASQTDCGHTKGGHRTVEAAVKCARAMLAKLPA